MILTPDPASWVDRACTVIAAACAVFVAFRDGVWRRSSLIARLNAAIAKAQGTADTWHESPEGKRLREQVEEHEDQLGHHGSKLVTLATKEDLDRLRNMVSGQGAKLDHTSNGVDRIESILLRRALETSDRRS